MSSIFPENPIAKGISVHLNAEPLLVFIQPFKPKDPTFYYSAMPSNAFGIQSVESGMPSVKCEMTSFKRTMPSVKCGIASVKRGMASVKHGITINLPDF